MWATYSTLLKDRSVEYCLTLNRSVAQKRLGTTALHYVPRNSGRLSGGVGVLYVM